LILVIQFKQLQEIQIQLKKEELKKALIEVDLPKHMNRLESILKQNGTGFFVGSNITYADLIIWYALDSWNDAFLVNISNLSLLSKFKASIDARPNIARYRTNPKRYPPQSPFGRYLVHAYAGNNNTNKAILAGLYGGIKVEVQPNFNMGVDNKTPEFLKKNPAGEVPTMDSPDGPIFESNAIAKYVARKGNDKGLYGANEYESSTIDQWLEFYRSKLENSVGAWVWPLFGYVEYNQEKYVEAKKDVAVALGYLNAGLEGKEYLVGKRVTLADIVLFTSLNSALTTVLEPEHLKPFPNVVAWVQRCYAQPHFKTVFPTFALCQKEKKFGDK